MAVGKIISYDFSDKKYKFEVTGTLLRGKTPASQTKEVLHLMGYMVLTAHHVTTPSPDDPRQHVQYIFVLENGMEFKLVQKPIASDNSDNLDFAFHSILIPDGDYSKINNHAINSKNFIDNVYQLGMKYEDIMVVIYGYKPSPDIELSEIKEEVIKSAELIVSIPFKLSLFRSKINGTHFEYSNASMGGISGGLTVKWDDGHCIALHSHVLGLGNGDETKKGNLLFKIFDNIASQGDVRGLCLEHLCDAEVCCKKKEAITFQRHIVGKAAEVLSEAMKERAEKARIRDLERESEIFQKVKLIGITVVITIVVLKLVYLFK